VHWCKNDFRLITNEESESFFNKGRKGNRVEINKGGTKRLGRGRDDEKSCAKALHGKTKRKKKERVQKLGMRGKIERALFSGREGRYAGSILRSVLVRKKHDFDGISLLALRRRRGGG